MKGFPVFIVIMAVLAGLPGGQRLVAQGASVVGTPYLTEYVTPTVKIRAGFVPSKAELVWGEPLSVTFRVENIGPAVFSFMFGGDSRGTGRHDRFKISMTDAKGNALADPVQHPMDFGGFLQPVNLKAGGVFTNVFNLADFRVIKEPGIYTVDCGFAFDDRFSGKETNNPVVKSTFTLTLLERTPERVATVLDELVLKAQATRGREVGETLDLVATFGKEAGIPRLVELAQNGPLERRAAALGALAKIPTEASLAAVLVGLNDADPVIRTAAAGSLGRMQNPRAVDALIEASKESSITEAIVLALGTTKADKAFPVLTNFLDAESIEIQRAAVQALAIFGGTNAITALTQLIHTNRIGLRYEIVLALAEKLRQPMQAEWLLPVLIEREQTHEWLDSLRLLRLYAGSNAIPTMLSCLDFEVAWSGRNWWILNEVRACPKSPPAEYAHDYNTDGTPEQWNKNLATLKLLRPLAGPIPQLPPRPSGPPIPYLATDPPIDFKPVFRELEDGDVEIRSGFFKATQGRGGGSIPYAVADAYQTVYREAARLRAFVGHPERYGNLNITVAQTKQLEDLLHQFARKLCARRRSDQKEGNYYNFLVGQPNYCPGDADCHSLLIAYKEAPPGPLREQARADLIDSVRVFSQNYHAGTVDFVEAGRKILTPEQLAGLLR